MHPGYQKGGSPPPEVEIEGTGVEAHFAGSHGSLGRGHRLPWASPVLYLFFDDSRHSLGFRV